MAKSSVDIGCAVRGLLACRYFCALGSSDGGIVGDGCICCLSQEEMSSVYFRSVSCDSRCTTDVLYFRTCSSQSLGTVCCRLARLLVECSREVPLVARAGIVWHSGFSASCPSAQGRLARRCFVHCLVDRWSGVAVGLYVYSRNSPLHACR